MEDKKYLFRYTPLGVGFRYKNLKRLILKNELVFVSPWNLNDPFDCKTLYSLKSAKDRDAQIKFVYNRARHNNRKNNLEQSDYEIINDIKKNFNHAFVGDDVKLKEQRDEDNEAPRGKPRGIRGQRLKSLN